MNEETQEVVVNFFPVEYQGYITAVFIIAPVAVIMYNLIIKPMLSKSTTNQLLLASQKRATDLEAQLVSYTATIETMVNETLSVADKANISKNILELELKLPYLNDVDKANVQAEIDRQKALLNV
jgi:hypothetical protein